MRSLESNTASEQLFSVGEVAAMWGFSVKTVRRLITRGEIAHHRMGGVIRISYSQAKAYKERTMVPASRQNKL